MRHVETPVAVVDSRRDLSQLTIRHLAKQDLVGLEWEGEYAHFRRLYAQAYERARQEKSILWVAEFGDGRLIGQIFVSLISSRRKGPHRGYIYSFRVRPAYRNLGIGTLLLDVVEKDLTERGIGIATLNVAQDNLAARRLYIRRGYRVVGTEPGVWQYVDHNGVRQTVREPAWRMEKVL
ncbi:MAG: GNAT family N-acetyltransferase [Anaerolineales bacterium]|nr:GNAT family N-acetyltransferase [Anaerolineales bacterium]